MIQTKNDVYKVIRELGYGVTGTVFLVTNKKKQKYVLKIKKIRKEDINISHTKNLIYFASNLAIKYPNNLSYMIDSGIINECTHSQKKPEFILNKEMMNDWNKTQESTYCFIEVYNYIKGNTIDHFMGNQNQNISLFMQMIYISYLIHKLGYVHMDMHFGNLMGYNTKEKYINILGYKVPTYGIMVSAIDYGEITKVKDNARGRLSNDVLEICHQFCNAALWKANYGYFQDCKKQNKKCHTVIWFLGQHERLMKLPVYKKIHNMCKHIKYGGDRIFMELIVLFLLSPKTYMKISKLPSKYSNNIEYIIPKEIIEFTLKNYLNHKKIIKYAFEYLSN